MLKYYFVLFALLGILPLKINAATEDIHHSQSSTENSKVFTENDYNKILQKIKSAPSDNSVIEAAFQEFRKFFGFSETTSHSTFSLKKSKVKIQQDLSARGVNYSFAQKVSSLYKMEELAMAAQNRDQTEFDKILNEHSFNSLNSNYFSPYRALTPSQLSRIAFSSYRLKFKEYMRPDDRIPQDAVEGALLAAVSSKEINFYAYRDIFQKFSSDQPLPVTVIAKLGEKNQGQSTVVKRVLDLHAIDVPKLMNLVKNVIKVGNLEALGFLLNNENLPKISNSWDIKQLFELAFEKGSLTTIDSLIKKYPESQKNVEEGQALKWIKSVVARVGKGESLDLFKTAFEVLHPHFTGHKRLELLESVTATSSNDMLKHMVQSGKFKIPSDKSDSLYILEPLTKAVEDHNKERIALIKQAGVDTGKAASKEAVSPLRGPLAKAIEKNDLEMAQCLFDNGASFDGFFICYLENIIKCKDLCILEWAVKNKKLIISKELHKESAFITILADMTKSPNAISQFEFLVDAGLDVSKAFEADTYNKNKVENSPLMAAIENEKADLAKRLLQMGADPNLPLAIGKGGSYLEKALNKNSKPLVEILLQVGAIPDTENSSPILSVLNSKLVWKNKIEDSLIMTTIRYGADLNRVTKESIDRSSVANDFTPLVYAAYFGQTEFVRQMVRVGADVTKKVKWKSHSNPRNAQEIAASQKKDDAVNYLDDLSYSGIAYPSKETFKNPYEYLSSNTLVIPKKNDQEDAQKAAAALSLHVLMGGTTSPWGVSATKLADQDQTRVMLQSIAAIAKQGNDDALHALVWQNHLAQSATVKKHKLAVYLLYKQARNEAPKLEDVAKPLGIKDQEELDLYSGWAASKYVKSDTYQDIWD